MLKKISVSENIIDRRTMSRLMKIEEDGSATLYLARSKSDTMQNDGYSVLTPVNRPEAKVTTPIMKLDGHNKIEQLYRGAWVGDTNADRMDYDDITYFHPTGLQDFLNLLSMTSWFDADDEYGTALKTDGDIDGHDVIVNLQVDSREVKSVDYLMKYEADISMYKLYRIEKINF